MLYIMSILFILKLRKIYYTFSLSFAFCTILCGAAPGVGDVGDDIVGLFQHPVVTPRDGVVRVDGLGSMVSE